LANVDRFSKFFHQVIRTKVIYVFDLTCNMLLHYLVKIKNPKTLLTWDNTATDC